MLAGEAADGLADGPLGLVVYGFLDGLEHLFDAVGLLGDDLGVDALQQLAAGFLGRHLRHLGQLGAHFFHQYLVVLLKLFDVGLGLGDFLLAFLELVGFAVEHFELLLDGLFAFGDALFELFDLFAVLVELLFDLLAVFQGLVFGLQAGGRQDVFRLLLGFFFKAIRLAQAQLGGSLDLALHDKEHGRRG